MNTKESLIEFQMKLSKQFIAYYNTGNISESDYRYYTELMMTDLLYFYNNLNITSDTELSKFNEIINDTESKLGTDDYLVFIGVYADFSERMKKEIIGEV